MTLKIGYAQQIITPDLTRPVYLAGLDHPRLAQSVHDNLFASALALEDDHSQLVLVSVDLIGLESAVYQEIAASLHAASPEAQMVISSTHTHHGPDTIGLWGPDMQTSGVDPLYMDSLKGKILQAASEALEHLVPADLKTGALRVSGVVKNARNPEILDEELTCLQFLNPQNGSPLVTLTNFACHPETLWQGNPQVTSDYIHYLRAYVQQQTSAPCIFFSSALGGMMTPDVVDHSFEEARANGEKLGEAALFILGENNAVQLDSFDYQRKEYEVPMQSPLLEQAIQIGLVQGPQQAEKGCIRTETSLLRLGPVGLVFVPGELLPKLGMQVKAMLHQSGFEIAGVIGLANDELGYILPDEDYQYPADPFAPGDHYEETMSIGPTAGTSLLHAIQTLL